MSISAIRSAGVSDSSVQSSAADGVTHQAYLILRFGFTVAPIVAADNSSTC